MEEASGSNPDKSIYYLCQYFLHCFDYHHLYQYYCCSYHFLFAQWWAIAGPEVFPWPIFVLFGWGIGVAAHGISAFRGEGYIEVQTEKEYQKLKKNKK